MLNLILFLKNESWKINNGEKYIFSVRPKDEDGNLEVELESTEDQFNQFYKMSTSGMYKTRYCFQ